MDMTGEQRRAFDDAARVVLQARYVVAFIGDLPRPRRAVDQDG